MKKACAVLVMLGLLVMLAACGSAPSKSLNPAPSALSGGAATTSSGHVAFLAREDQQSSVLGTEVWSAVSLFAGEEGIANSLYTVTNEDALATTELAIKSGANAIVMMGADMLEVVNNAKRQYPNVYFVLIDAKDSMDVSNNAAQIEISYGHAGWMAGYAAVMDGYTRLAYFQADIPEAQRRALGFVWGAEAAAAQKGLGADAIQIIPLKTAEEESAAGWRTAMSAAYGNGIQAIFVNDSGLRSTALAAAKTAEGKIISVADIAAAAKQKSDLVLVTVIEGVYNTVYATLSQWKNTPQKARGMVYSGIAEGDISFVAESVNFSDFKKADYQELLALFDNKELSLEVLEKTTANQEGTLPDAQQLVLTHVQIGYPKPSGKQSASSSSAKTSGEPSPSIPQHETVPPVQASSSPTSSSESSSLSPPADG